MNENDLTPGIIKKIAYISASFWVFTVKVIPSEDARREICKKLEAALLKAFKVQMGIVSQNSISSMIEDLILSALNSGQYARIRGKGSEGTRVKVWYDPRKEVFLLPSTTWYEELKSRWPTLNERHEKPLG